MGMLREFKEFLTKTNALALAIGVVIGAAVGKVVSTIVSALIMPFVGLILPDGEWRAWTHGPTTTDPVTKQEVGVFKTGELLGAVVDFVIIAFVIFLIMKALLREKPKPAAAPPALKECPQCCEQIPFAAKKCRACTSPV